MHTDLTNPSLVPSSLEGSVQEHHEDLVKLLLCEQPPREGEHVGIVVGSGVISNFGSPAQRGTDSLVLIHSHVDAVAGSADSDTGVALTIFYGQRHGMGVVGIVTALGRVRPKILVRDSLLFEHANDILLGFKSGVIGSQRNRFFCFIEK